MIPNKSAHIDPYRDGKNIAKTWIAPASTVFLNNSTAVCKAIEASLNKKVGRYMYTYKSYIN